MPHPETFAALGMALNGIRLRTMLSDYWPLFGLTIHTPQLELRVPTDDELVEMASVAAKGIHEPGEIVFGDMWTNHAPDAVARHVLQWNWRTRADWTERKWTLSFAAFRDGQIVGNAWMFAEHFNILKSFGTSSWLGKAHQGKGLGKEMRAAQLFFGFEGLSAHEARTNALAHNAASIGVTRSMGYEDNGRAERLVGGKAVTGRLFRMSRESWLDNVRERYQIAIEGLDACRDLFGIDETRSE